MTTRKMTIILAGMLLSLLAAVGAGAGTVDEIANTPSCVSTEGAAIGQASLADGSTEAASEEDELVCAAKSSKDTVRAGLVEMPVDDLADRAAICRLIPQCSTNADCDAQCGGEGLGRCAHSRCPVRVCRCR